jgi:hypothetical protein
MDIDISIAGVEIRMTRQEFFQMKCDLLELERLKSYGVDNWSFYGDALDGFEEEKDDMYEKLFLGGKI